MLEGECLWQWNTADTSVRGNDHAYLPAMLRRSTCAGQELLLDYGCQYWQMMREHTSSRRLLHKDLAARTTSSSQVRLLMRHACCLVWAHACHAAGSTNAPMHAASHKT